MDVAVRVVAQARMGSTRLPGKTLKRLSASLRKIVALHCGQRIHKPSGTPRFAMAVFVIWLRLQMPGTGPLFISTLHAAKVKSKLYYHHL